MPTLTRTDRRVLQASQEIAKRPQPTSAQRVFCARELVVATLPHQAPPKDAPAWVRRNGFYTLSMRPGYRTDPDTGERVCLGYPFGVVPRLILLWLNTQAVLTHRRRLHVGRSFNDFLRHLGLSPETGGGRRSDFRRVREQLERLFRTTLSFEYPTSERTGWCDVQVAPHGNLWWSVKRDQNPCRSPSWIELGDTFYRAVTAKPVPLDVRAVRALQSSPLALDLYAWSSYRYFGVCQTKRPAFIPWRGLMAQLGTGYASHKDFKRRCKPTIRRLRALYPHLRMRTVRGGIRFRPGEPLIAAS